MRGERRGGEKKHWIVGLCSNGRWSEAIGFVQKRLEGQQEDVNVGEKPARNEYAGQQTWQLVVEYIEAMS